MRWVTKPLQKLDCLFSFAACMATPYRYPSDLGGRIYNVFYTMKKLFPSLLTAVALTLALAPTSYGADSKPEKKAKEEIVPTKKASRYPFHGDVTAVDAKAGTFSLHGAEKERVFKTNPQTAITKGGKVAKLADAVVGEPAAGYCERQADGTVVALKVRFGAKPEEPKSEPSESNKKKVDKAPAK